MQLTHTSVSYALAGIAFFMFGMSLASEGLQKLAANQINKILSQSAKTPILGVFMGIILTVLIQSSGAVTSMLVGLGTAGVIKLSQVMSLIIGTAIGTTITVQIISLKITQYGLPLFTFGFSVYFLTTKKVLKNAMSVVMGFGLIFWGLEMIGLGTQDLRQLDYFTQGLNLLKSSPIATILIMAIFTAVVHSSAVTIGFAMTLAANGDLTLLDAMYWVYGANIGTTATALVASAGGNYVGKQVALAHFIYKLLSVLLFYFVTDYFAQFVTLGNPMRDVANAHTLFNILCGLLFFPFIQVGGRWVERLIPQDTKEFGVKYIDKGAIDNPSVALAHAVRETLRMADIVVTMVADSIKLFEKEDDELIESIQNRDNKVDLLNREINLYLSEVVDSPSNINNEVYRLLSFVTDLESIGDVIDNSLLEMAKKKNSLKIEFSKEGWEDLKQIHLLAKEVTELSMSAFQLHDTELGAKVIFLKREVRKVEKNLRLKHIERLVSKKESTQSGHSLQFDILSDYRRIAGLACNHVYGILKDSDKYNIVPRRED